MKETPREPFVLCDTIRLLIQVLLSLLLPCSLPNDAASRISGVSSTGAVHVGLGVIAAATARSDNSCQRPLPSARIYACVRACAYAIFFLSA